MIRSGIKPCLTAGLFLLVGILAGCSLFQLRPLDDVPTVDPEATPETKALFMNLFTLSVSGTLFGHEDDLAYGVHWRNVPGRSDVLETAGSYPAVYGWDVGNIGPGEPENLDSVPFDDMREWIKEGYKRGGVITISWHMDNPVSGDHAWDTDTPAVSRILPGGTHHDVYRTWLDRFAVFASSLEVSGTEWNPDRHKVPVIFRPFHEHNIGAFWWGDLTTSESDYIALWRFTVEYLRDEKGLRNLLYAYSPNTLGMERDRVTGLFDTPEDCRVCAFEREYLYAYPGDEYVDVFGLDDYNNPWVDFHRGPSFDRNEAFKQGLSLLVDLSQTRSDIKIPALTETGLDTVPDNDWWTDFLLDGITGMGTPKVAWVLVWRNAALDHFFAPYAGHDSESDFRDFRAHRFVLFEDDLPYSLYSWPP